MKATPRRGFPWFSHFADRLRTSDCRTRIDSVKIIALYLRLGWPATEWETGPEPKMAGEMAGGRFSGGGSEMAGQMAGQPRIG